LQVFDRRELVFGQQISTIIIDAGLPPDRAGRRPVVAKQKTTEAVFISLVECNCFDWAPCM